MQKFIERIFLLALMVMPWVSWSQENNVLSCDFENVAADANWTFVNGGQTNGWAIGTAMHSGNGNRGLYISSDNGATYGYSEVMAADVYIYQQLNLTAGMYQYSYDWTCKGETTLDCFRVMLVPASVDLTGGQIYPGLSGDATPAGWLAMDGGAKLTGEDNMWDTYRGVVNVPSDGNYKLVFYWTNDGSTTNGLPAAIDNITMKEMSCMPPSNIAASMIGSDNVTLIWQDDNAMSWNVEYGVAGFTLGEGTMLSTQTQDISISGLNSSTEYDFYVRSICGDNDSSIDVRIKVRTACPDITIPYMESFETSLEGNTPNCWINHGGVTNVVTDNKTSAGSKSLQFAASGVLVSPYINMSAHQVSVSFMLRREDAQAGKIKVGFVSQLTDIDNMIPLAVINPDHNLYYDYDVEFTNAEDYSDGYIVWKQETATTNHYYWMDSVRIQLSSTCRRPMSMSAHDITHNSAQLSWHVVEDVSEYQVAYGFVNSPEDQGAHLIDVEDTIVTISNLDAMSTYSAWVRSKCSENEFSEWRACANFATQPSCAPIISLSAPTITANGMALTWNYDTEVGNPATGAELSWKKMGDPAFTTVVTDQSSYFIHGLEADTTYEIRIRALCSTEQSLSITSHFKTPPCGHVVSRGTEGTTYIPMGGMYNYSYSQMLYPASDLLGLSSIEGISLRMKSGEQTRNVNIYMGNVSQTELTAENPIPLSSMTLVAENVSYTLTEGWCSVQFTTPFVYDGTSNLVVAIDDNTSSYAVVISDNVYYHEGSSLYLKSDDININPANPSTMNQFAGVADITFLGDCNATACSAPLLTVNEVSTNSIQLAWAPGASETSWQVEYKELDADSWTVASSNVTDTFYTINGLTNGTPYTVRVGSHCNSVVYYSYVHAMTICGTLSTPYTEDFNSGEMNPCWTVGNSNGRGDMPEVGDLSGTLNFRDRDGGYVVLPAFDTDVYALSVRFDMMSMFLSSKMVVKVGTSPNDFNTFVPIDTISVNTVAQYEPKLCNLINYSGEGRYIMFHSLGRQVYIDNISIDVTPECSTPINVEVSNVVHDGADISWECDNSNTESWLISWKVVGTTEMFSETIDGMNDPMHTIIGLTPNVDYAVYVSNICHNGDTMRSVAPVVFHTSCSDVQIPYLENFEGETEEVFPICWSHMGTDSYFDENFNYWTVPTIVNTGSDNGLALALSMNKTAITPRVPIAADTILLNFDMRSEDYESTGKMVIGFSTSDSNMSDMVVVDTIDITSNAWTNYEVAFNVLDIEEMGYVVFKNIDNNGVYNSFDEVYQYSAIFIDNVAISYNNGCGRVNDVAISNVASSSATVSFSDVANVGNYTIGWATTNNSAAIGSNHIITTSTTAIITGLQPLTRYYVWVRVNCADDAVGNWTPAPSFMTPCSAATLPYTENFDSYTTDISSVDLAPGRYPNHTMPNCWIFQNMSMSANVLPQAYLFRPAPGTYADSANCLYFRSKANTAMFATLPSFNQSLTSLMISFTYRNEGETPSNGILTLGVLTDINDTSSFIALETYPRTTTRTTIEHIFAFDASLVQGTDYTIAFRYMGGDYNDKALGIDNIVVEVAPECLKPISLTLESVTDNSATISWLGTATNYNVAYRIADSTTWIDLPAAVGTSTTITGLTSLESYEVRVQAICGEGEFSEWSNSILFTTQCGAMDIPYVENFDSYTEDIAPSSYAPEAYPNHTMPLCWSFPILSNNNPKVFLSSKSGYTIGTGNCLFFVSSNEHDAYAVLPAMNEPIDTLRINFKYRNESTNSSNGILSIGVLTNPVDTTTFIELETYPVVGGLVSAQHTFSLDEQLNDNTDYYIAFRYHGVNNNYYLSIDDVQVDYAPVCATPSMPELVSVDATTATVDFGMNASEYIVNYRLSSATAWHREVVTENPYTLTNLTAVSEYELRVRAICSSTDTSEWSPILTFSTSCAVYDLPFSEDFSNVDNMITNLYCWNMYTGLLNANGTANLTPSTYAWDLSLSKPLNDGGKNMYIRIDDADDCGWLVTPEMNIVPASTLTFNLGRREPFSGNDVWDNDDKFVVLATTDQGATWTTLQTWTGNDYQSIPVYTSPAQEVSIALDQFANQIVRIAFYGESTVSSGSDHYIHIDNVEVSTAMACPTPTRLVADNITHHTADLSWSHSAISFDLDYRPQDSTEWISVPVNITSPSYQLTDLLVGTTYQWRVRANCSATDSSDWDTATFTTLDCARPTNVQINTTYTSVTISWTDTEHSLWEVKVTGGAEDIVETATSTSITIENLDIATAYQAYVRASCEEGIFSNWTDAISFSTESCEPVTNVTASNVTKNSAVIKWTPTGDESSWELQYGEEGFGSSEAISVMSDATTYTLNNLDEGTAYEVYVRAKCTDQFNSLWSTSCKFTTKGGQEGIDAIDGNFNFAIYPNPTNGATTISLMGVDGQVEISIVDMNGRTLTRESIECGVDCEKRLDVSGLTQGTYFVRVIGSDINSVRKLIVK